MLFYSLAALPVQAQTQPREADVMWERTCWRLLDLREKQNQHLYHPQTTNGHQNLMTLLRDALLVNPTLTAYDPQYDDFRIKLTPAEITAIWTETIHIPRQRPYPPYADDDTVIVRQLDPNSIKKIKLKEHVFFNRQTSQMEVRIVALCPVMERQDPLTGERRGYSDMFWIYFPEFLLTLADKKINLGLGTAVHTLSYADVFLKRYFSSYIYKEDNVYNRKTEDYLRQSLEQLLESDRIKETIRLYEEDLWEQ